MEEEEEEEMEKGIEEQLNNSSANLEVGWSEGGDRQRQGFKQFELCAIEKLGEQLTRDL